MTPPRPARRPAPRRGRRAADRPAADRRAVLKVEPLEDRLQPSTAAPLSPDLSAALVAPETAFTTPVLSDALPQPAAAAVRAPADFSAPASSVVGPHRRELLLVEFDVPDRDELVRDLLARPAPGTDLEVVELQGGGVAEVTSLLSARPGLDAVHLVTHGAEGALDLGSEVLDARTLTAYSADLRAWGAALNPGGDLLLYGCNVAAGGGAGFVTELSSLTGADVAASTDATGAAALGGNWALEYATGPVAAATLAAPAGWAHTLDADFLFATHGNVSGAGTTGLTSWSNGQVLQMGGANFAVEPGTSSGTVSGVFDLRQFGGGSVGIDALHLVRNPVTVGTGAATMTLLPGDLLVSTDNNATLTGTSGALAVTDDEVFVFRPTRAGDYSAGSFTMLLDHFTSITGGSKTWAVTVAEADVQVGDYLVKQGTFLYTRDGGSQDDQIAMFTPTGVGAGTTAGTTAVLIDGGADLGMGPAVRGLDLVEAPTTMAGRALAAGTIVLALDSNATVGTNKQSVTANDVFTLTASQTTLVAGKAVANASLLFQGADAGLSGSNAKFTAVSLAGRVGNSPPTATPDGYSTAEDQPLTVAAAAGVLVNDTDPDADPLTVTAYTQPAHGAVTVTADGGFTYTPDANYNGSDSYSYTVSDGHGGTAVGTVSLSITPVNDPPVAADDHYSTAINLLILSTPLSVSAPGVLANDTDVDGDPLTAQLLTQPANGGLLTFNPDGSFTYTALLNFSGTDSFTYRVSDGKVWSAPATVYINVSSPNRAPVATADAYTAAEDTPLTVAAPGVLGNDADPDGDTLRAVVDTGPAHGTLVLSADGSFTYTPNPDWSGTDSFTYHASDGSLNSAVVVVTITVTPVNDPPTLDPIPDQTILEDAGPVSVTLTGITAGGGETQPLTVTATSSDPTLLPPPTVAYTSPAATGTLTFTPAPNANGSATITVTVSDGQATTSRTFTVDITPVNDPPVAADDTATTPEDTPVPITVLANDSDVDGDVLAVTTVGPAGHGAVTTDGTTVTYAPDPNWNGTDSFTYTVSDGNGGSASATVTVVVTPVNDPPVATDDSYPTRYDTPLVVTDPGVLVNDTDADGDPLVPAVVTLPLHGTVVLLPTGGFTYTPDPGFVGVDSFTYQATDPSLAASVPATVTVAVGLSDAAPVAADDSYTGAEDTTLAGASVLSNDADPDGDAMTARLVSGPAHGQLALNADGTFTYTPDSNWNGTDSFVYEASDPQGTASAPATVTLTIAAVNDPPVAADDSAATAEDTAVTVAVLVNDSDADGDPLTLVIAGGAGHGTVTTAGATVTYAPDANWSGTDTFSYTVSDGNGGTATATVTVTVTPVNDPPAAADDSATTPEDTPVPIAVLANDTDLDGDALTVLAVNPAGHGTVTTDGTTVTYAPDPNWYGTDSFTYTASDGQGGTATATLTITVTPVNDPPLATDDTATTLEDTAVVVAVLVNDSDVEGDALTITAVGPAGHGMVSTDGVSVTYTPAPNWNGTDTFTYTISDGNGGSATATVTVVVTPVNDPPVAADDYYSTTQNTALTVGGLGVLANDTDVDGDRLTATLVTGPANGTLTFNSDGTFTYTPAPAFTGTDTFAYRASDGQAASAVTTVTLTILPPTGRPVAANDDAYLVTAGGVLDVSAAAGVLANDTGSGTGRLTATLVSGPSNGTLTFRRDGSFTYTPNAGFSGTDAFNYKASDGGGTSGTVHVSITVTGGNHPPAAGADAYTTDSGVALLVAAPGVLANDSDPDGNPITAELATAAAHGTVTMAADGSFTYTPDDGFSGTDTFTYRAFDGGLYSGLVTVTITVRPAALTTPPDPSDPGPTDPTPTDPTPTDPSPAEPTSTGPTPSGSTATGPAAPNPPPHGSPTAGTPVVTSGPSVTTAAGPPAFGPPAAATTGASGGPAGSVVTITTAVASATTPTHASNGITPVDRGTTSSDAGRVFAPSDPPAVAAAPPAASQPALPPEARPTPNPPPSVAAGPVFPPAPPTVLTAPLAPAVTRSAAELVPPDAVLAPLELARAELRAEAEERAMTDAIVVSGGVAVAGYVLLNTRAVYWFLSALLARPAVWRRFDPLEVVYAWEKDGGRRSGPADPGADESLQSIVG